jgi:hypothetical protein
MSHYWEVALRGSRCFKLSGSTFVYLVVNCCSVRRQSVRRLWNRSWAYVMCEHSGSCQFSSLCGH